MFLPTQGFIYALTAPGGQTPSKDLALTLVLAAASDKCWALSLKPGRECLEAAGHASLSPGARPN